jgi:hypothetical protein
MTDWIIESLIAAFHKPEGLSLYPRLSPNRPRRRRRPRPRLVIETEADYEDGRKGMARKQAAGVWLFRLVPPGNSRVRGRGRMGMGKTGTKSTSGDAQTLTFVQVCAPIR